MIPASFAPMILKLVFPKLEKKMDKMKLDIIEHIFKVGKIKESIAYRELPNDADILGKKCQEHITMLAGELSAQDDRLKKLETLSIKPKKVK
tara:strand:- start:863 stop:1138 length:276 start_codon:yes stop_codon:yes gene_type:complete